MTDGGAATNGSHAATDNDPDQEYQATSDACLLLLLLLLLEAVAASTACWCCCRCRQQRRQPEPLMLTSGVLHGVLQLLQLICSSLAVSQHCWLRHCGSICSGCISRMVSLMFCCSAAVAGTHNAVGLILPRSSPCQLPPSNNPTALISSSDMGQVLAEWTKTKHILSEEY